MYESQNYEKTKWLTPLIPSKSLSKSEGVRLLEDLPGITNPIARITNESSHGRRCQWNGKKEIMTHLPAHLTQFTLKFASRHNICLVFFRIMSFVIEYNIPRIYENYSQISFILKYLLI